MAEDQDREAVEFSGGCPGGHVPGSSLCEMELGSLGLLRGLTTKPIGCWPVFLRAKLALHTNFQLLSLSGFLLCLISLYRLMIKVRLFMIVLKTIHALVHVCILPTTEGGTPRDA